MEQHEPTIPPFRADGYLPDGVYSASEAEVTFRFGASSRRRRRLALRLRRWIQLGRQVGGKRLLVDGSFVTAKANPNDLDAVIFLPQDFEQLVEDGVEAALELEEMLLTRRPEEIFAAEDEDDWNGWVEFFGRTREADGRRKGLVDCTMIANDTEYQKAQEEIRALEGRLERLQVANPIGSKGFTKAGIRKMIARLHEELAIYEGSVEARQTDSN